MKKLKNFFAIAAMILFVQSGFATIHIVFVGQGGGFTFSPVSIPNVAVGDTIRWQYGGSNSHTTTSVSIPSGAASWNSPMTASVTSFDYKVTEAGTYNYKCNPHGGGGMTGSFVASVVTSAEANNSVYATLVASPNPATDVIKLQFNSDKSFNGMIMISDGSGVRVKDEKIKVKAGENEFSVAISKLAKGTYILNVIDGETALAAKKFIKE